jgi:hypothetical protein
VVRKTPTPNTLILWTTGRNFNPSLKTEIEVRFIADGSERTRVELEYRHLDRYRARRGEMRRIHTEGDWSRLF